MYVTRQCNCTRRISPTNNKVSDYRLKFYTYKVSCCVTSAIIDLNFSNIWAFGTNQYISLEECLYFTSKSLTVKECKPITIIYKNKTYNCPSGLHPSAQYTTTTAHDKWSTWTLLPATMKLDHTLKYRTSEVHEHCNQKTLQLWNLTTLWHDKWSTQTLQPENTATIKLDHTLKYRTSEAHDVTNTATRKHHHYETLLWS